jgi:cyclophilin family peptidyl-prolyl cis-trans isomerase
LIHGAGEDADTRTERQTMAKQWKQPFEMSLDDNKTYTATLETSHGNMDVEFFVADAPNTVNNFVSLAKEGYYDGTPFHRIIKGFMLQGGDPTGTGMGGPGYKFADEKVTKQYTKGTLAMANAGPNTNGSQFFIMHADYPLPPNYTIFGKVTSGMDVVDAIANVPVGASRGGERSTPLEPVTLQKVTINES